MRARAATVLTLLAAAPFAIGPPAAHPQQSSATPKPAGADKTAERPEDTRAIRALGESFARAYNRGDARAIADLFTEGAEVIDDGGAAVRGREAIARHFASTFAGCSRPRRRS